MSRSQHPNHDKMRRIADQLAADHIQSEIRLAKQLQADYPALSWADALVEAKRLQDKLGPGMQLVPQGRSTPHQENPMTTFHKATVAVDYGKWYLDAYGATADEAREGLIQGLQVHLQQCDYADPEGWLARHISYIEMDAVTIGAVYRDREVLIEDARPKVDSVTALRNAARDIEADARSRQLARAAERGDDTGPSLG